MNICVLTLLAALSLSACSGLAPPEPWERGLLAKPEMRLEGDALQQRYEDHIHTSRENASGGFGVGGGGCGCN